MRRFLVLAAATATLAGCGGTYWYKPGATHQDYLADSYSCEKDQRQSGYYGRGVLGAINMDGFGHRCLEAHGWRLRSTTSPPPQVALDDTPAPDLSGTPRVNSDSGRASDSCIREGVMPGDSDYRRCYRSRLRLDPAPPAPVL